MVPCKRRGDSVIKPRVQKPDLQQRHYYALVGLSVPTVFDEVVGSHVPHKLSQAEYEYMIEETEIAEDLKWAVSQSELYLTEAHPNGKVYYKNSRWSNTAPLRVLSISQSLYEVNYLSSCWNSSYADK